MLSGLQKLPVQTQKSVQSPRLVFLANYGIVQVDCPDKIRASSFGAKV